MTREEAIKVLEMFLHKQCDLEGTKFAYDQLMVWDAVKMASEALEQPEIIRCGDCLMHGVCRFEIGLGENGFCSQGKRENENE